MRILSVVIGGEAAAWLAGELERGRNRDRRARSDSVIAHAQHQLSHLGYVVHTACRAMPRWGRSIPPWRRSGYAARYREATAAIAGWIADGQLKVKEHVVTGTIDDFPDTLQMLFRGENVGKLVLQLR